MTHLPGRVVDPLEARPSYVNGTESLVPLIESTITVRPSATSTLETSRSIGGSKRPRAAAISWKVCSLTCWPTICPSGFTPMSTRPPDPLANAQID